MAHPDLDKLINILIPFAQKMLAKNGEFFPFGSSILKDGTMIDSAAYDGNKHQSSKVIIDLLTTAYCQKASRGDICAAGICQNVRTIPPGQVEKVDAIFIGLEHQSGETVNVYIPYKKGKRGKVDYGDLFAMHRDPQFFLTAEVV